MRLNVLVTNFSSDAVRLMVGDDRIPVGPPTGQVLPAVVAAHSTNVPVVVVLPPGRPWALFVNWGAGDGMGPLITSNDTQECPLSDPVRVLVGEDGRPSLEAGGC